MKIIINNNDNKVTTIKIVNNSFNYIIKDVDWKQTFLMSLDWENDIIFEHIYMSDYLLEHILKLKYDNRLR